MSAAETYTIKATAEEIEHVRAVLATGAVRRKRSRMFRENGDYAATVVRMVRSMARRAAGDPDLLPALRQVSALVDELMPQAVARLRAEGYSWAEIADRLGTSRQNAQQRYGATERRATDERQPGVDADQVEYQFVCGRQALHAG